MNGTIQVKCILALFLMILLGICLATCGRKRKNIFSFSNDNMPVVNKLSLPVVRGITLQKANNGYLINWLMPDLSQVLQEKSLLFKKNLASCFIGFNIYRLVRNNIIPKHPINKKPITTTEYLDKKAPQKKQTLYLVKIVFSINQQIIEGPASAIACI